MELKLIIAGSRTFCCPIEKHDAAPISTCQSCIDKARLIHKVLVESCFAPTEIVSGCAKGADKLGELYAQKMNLPVKKFPAKWRVGGRVNMAAGFERNESMARYASAALVLWDGQSKGSQDMARRMKKAGKLCVVYNFVTGKIE